MWISKISIINKIEILVVIETLVVIEILVPMSNRKRISIPIQADISNLEF